MKTQIQRENIYSLIFHTGICALLAIGVLLLQYYYPVAYVYLIAEDHWGEYGTFFCYMLAGLLIAWAVKSDRKLRRPGYALLCLGLFFIGMEEISWGQRIFGIHVPYNLIARHNLQSELNIHNFGIFHKKEIFFHVLLLWSVFLPLISYKYKRLHDFLNKIGIPLVPIRFIPYFMVSFFVF